MGRREGHRVPNTQPPVPEGVEERRANCHGAIRQELLAGACSVTGSRHAMHPCTSREQNIIQPLKKMCCRDTKNHGRHLGAY